MTLNKVVIFTDRDSTIRFAKGDTFTNNVVWSRAHLSWVRRVALWVLLRGR